MGGTDDPNWNATVEATDHPDFNPQPIDLAAALRKALSQRTDLELAKQTLQVNDITLRVQMRDQLKPQANLIRLWPMARRASAVRALERASTTAVGAPVTTTLPGGDR